MKLSPCRTLSAGIPAGGPASIFSVGLARRQGTGTLHRSSKALGRRKGPPNAIALARSKRAGRISEMLRFDGVRLHDLRHSFASFADQSGGSLYLVGKLLGNKTEPYH
jgi:integrase